MNTRKELNYRLYIQRIEDFHRLDVRTEFARYEAIKQGDVEKVLEYARNIKADFYKGKGTLSDNPLRNNIYHLVVAAGVIARSCIEAGMPQDEAYTLSDIYIRNADRAQDPDKVIDLIVMMQIDFATHMKELRNNGPVSIHIRSSIDYIYDHLNEPLTTEQLARHCRLNQSYFSKLFKAETGLTSKAYILKAKLKTARFMLEEPGYKIADIAYSLGFSSQSAFSAAFKAEYHTTPAKYQKQFAFTPVHSIAD